MSSREALNERVLGGIQVFIAEAVMTNERIARSLGLNVVDLQALGYIVRSEHPLTAGELSKLTEMPTSSTTRVIDRLERSGFIERGADPADRRRVVVTARPELIERIGRGGPGDPYSEIHDAMYRLHEGFTDEELEVVARYFEATAAARIGH